MRLLLTCLGLVLALAVPARAETLVDARFDAPTTRYDHGVLGDAVEWGALVLTTSSGNLTIRLPDTRVFEDLAPRLVPSTTGETLAMVVESDLAKGARLALYAPDGLRAATPFIGRPHRWLAPVGAGDFDGDGAVEYAYVDRPHLAKTLRVWRLVGDGLVEVAALPGVTNHQIGWDFIAGGLRDCGPGPEMILASDDWRSVMAVTLKAGVLSADRLGPLASVDDIEEAMACR